MILSASAHSLAGNRHVLRPLSAETVPIVSALADAEEDQRERLFTIRAADSDGHRSSARILVDRMYAWRGYQTAARSEAARDRVTLIANEHDVTIGTLTIGFDGPQKMLVDELFPDEALQLRGRHGALCEFTKLAVDGAFHSKRVLASLFHVAFLYAYEIRRCERILIEVNPRHVRYYQRMLGFDLHSGERPNARVNAPAVLLSLDAEHAREQIDRFGGRPELAPGERSLYPYFFSLDEENGILHRVRSVGSNAQRARRSPLRRLVGLMRPKQAQGGEARVLGPATS